MCKISLHKCKERKALSGKRKAENGKRKTESLERKAESGKRADAIALTH